MAGSYPYAEVYIMQCDDLTLKARIRAMKERQPEMNVIENDMDGNQYNVDHEDEWFEYFFIRTQQGGLFHVCVHKRPNNPAHLLLVDYGETSKIYDLKCVNSDEMSKKESKAAKRLFEKEILSQLGLKWKYEDIWQIIFGK
ncbi:MAG: hypothetical protein EOL95_05965 [Bacteroidia bacterium]|nr:hypothetical protein [Bacteroidia bacterium]